MARKKKLSDLELKKKRKESLIQNCIFIDIFIIYFCMLLGYGFVKNAGENAMNIILDVVGSFPGNFYKIFPTSPGLLFAGIIIGALVDVIMVDSYIKKKDIVQNPNGDAAFEEDFAAFDQEFVIDPAIVEKVTGVKPKTYYDDEHKKIVTSPKIKHNLKDKIYKACWFQTQLYADKVAISLNGSWAQRNSNAIIFGASGAGKSRYFLNPNLLQANSNYVVTDPSGEIMLGYGAFLQKEEGYVVKCLNISDMEHSCRFNPLQYIKDASDIPVIVTTLMENTQKKQGGGGGDGDFWTKTTQALLCAIIGYLYEVEPMERRNFYNVLEMLRMAQEDEDAQDQEATDFDKMFEVLGRKNPNSYAFHQYQTYSLAPRKTALNILISTAVLLSTFIDIPEFNNLTYKDEMELDKFGAAPYKLQDGVNLFPEDEERYKERYASKAIPEGYIDVEDFRKYKKLIQKDDKGRYVEGAPYKMAVFLCIPTADTTYNWLTAMLYSIVFKLIYRRGETRAKEQVMPNPKLAYPARLLIDECANIGKIPNLQEYLATCRKYGISIVPIFQSFSQIQKVYGKEDANSIYANCDTTLFLGGVDSETLKIVCERLGKESVKALSTGTSGGGMKKSNSTNLQNVGRELMSRIQVEQMSNAECLVFIRALKPFKVKKFNLNGHPNYKYTAEADPDGHSFVNPFDCEYDDLAIESIRIKKVGELGYNEPQEVNSARLRAAKQESFAARKEMAISLQRAASQYGHFDEDAVYDSEQEKKEALADHEAYIDALRTVYTEAKDDGDSYAMDVIRSTCSRYDIDIGMDIGIEIRESTSRSRTISNFDEVEFNEEELFGVPPLRELREEDALNELKRSMTYSSPYISGITTEFDLATMDQVLTSLAGMVKDADGNSLAGNSLMEHIREETEKVSDVKINEDVEKVESKPKKKKEEEKVVNSIYIQQQEEIVDIDWDDDGADEAFDSVTNSEASLYAEELANIGVENAENNESESIEDIMQESQEVTEVAAEDIVPTEEELNNELSGTMDFSNVNESEEIYTDIDDSDSEGLEVFIDSGEDGLDVDIEEEVSTEVEENKAKNSTVERFGFAQEVKAKEFNAESLAEAVFAEETADESKNVNAENSENSTEELEVKKGNNSEEESEESETETKAPKVEESAAETKPVTTTAKQTRKSRFTISLDDDDDDDF